MKTIFILNIFLISSIFCNAVTPCNDNDHIRSKNPLYAVEFAEKFGVPYDKIKNWDKLYYHIKLREALLEIGLSKSISNARNAIDDFNGQKYFLITEDEGSLTVARQFVLDEYIVTYSMFFKKNKEGSFTDLILSKSYR